MKLRASGRLIALVLGAAWIASATAAEAPKTIELVFTAPVKNPPPGAKQFPGDVKVSFNVPSLKLEKGSNVTVTATIDPPSAEVSFTVSNAQIASITSQTSKNGTVQITLRGDADGTAFLRCQSQGHIVYGALRVSVGQVAAKKANAVAKKAAAAEDQLFTVSKYLDMSFTPGAEGDFLHGDLVALKAPVDSGIVIPPFKPELVWVGGKWSDYSQYTKIEYITENSGMTAGPDFDFTSEGNGTETISGSGGEGVWFFGFAIWVRVSDGASWYAYTPAAIITATQRITITSVGVTKTLEPGDTFEQFNDYMIIRKAPPPTYPPTGIAKTTTPLIPVGGTAKLDGSQSYDNDENGASVVEWRWKFDNLTTPEDDVFTTVTDKPTLDQKLSTAGEYQVTLIVKDNEGELSTPTASDSEVTIKVVGVTFDPATVNVTVSATASTAATIIPANAVNSVTFKSDNSAIATVDRNKLSNTPGTLTISGLVSGSTVLRAEIDTDAGSATVGAAPIVVSVPSDVKFSFEGRPVLFDSNSDGVGLTKVTEFVVVLVTPENAKILPTGDDDWTSTDGTMIEIGQPIGSVSPNRVARQIRGGRKGGKADVQVKVSVEHADGRITVHNLENTFGNIQLIASPAKPNPPQSWFPPGPLQAPNDATRDFSVESIPVAPGAAYAFLKLLEVKHFWEATSDSFKIVGLTDQTTTSIQATKPSKNFLIPDPAEYSMLIKGLRLEGGLYSADDTNPNVSVRGKKNVPVLINGAEITVAPPDPLCVGESFTLIADIRAGDGRGTALPATLVNAPVVNGNKMTVVSNKLFLDTPGINRDGTATVKLTYESPSAPGAPIGVDVPVRVLPVDQLTIQDPEICFGDDPVKLKAIALCGAKEIVGAKIRWKLLNAGGTNCKLDPDTGVLSPGLIPGTVTIEASILATDSPQYVLADLRTQKAIIIHDLSVFIPQAPGSGTIISCFGITLTARVFCGPHEITGQAGVEVVWPKGGPAFERAGVYQDVFARAKFRKRTADSQKFNVVIIDDELPHLQGDFSVNANNKDVTKSEDKWVHTRYFYSNLLELSGGFTIENDRYIPGVVGGHPTSDHVRNGIMSKEATLLLWCHGIQTPTLKFNGVAYSNGKKIRGNPYGGVWKFDIDIKDVLFPNERGEIVRDSSNKIIDGKRPIPAINQVQAQGVELCAYELGFNAMSPYVLIHGKGADHKYWNGTNADPNNAMTCWIGITDALKEAFIPYDNSIDLTASFGPESQFPSQGSIADQGSQLDEPIASIVNSFGTTHFNLMGHSKGGLDSRFWLGLVKPTTAAFSHDLILGQFITLNTPHEGSVIADYAYGSSRLQPGDLIQAPGALIDMKYPFLSLGGIADKLAAGSPATRDLQVSSLINFNNANLPLIRNYSNPDKTKPTFVATSSDADIDGDGEINLPLQYGVGSGYVLKELQAIPGLQILTAAALVVIRPDFGPPYYPGNSKFDETAESRCWDGWVGFFVTGTIGARTAYYALRDIQSVTFKYPNGSTNLILVIEEIPRAKSDKQDNDFLVTRRSAEFQAPFQTAPKLFFNGKPKGTRVGGKMHGDIADIMVGRDLISDKKVMPTEK